MSAMYMVYGKRNDMERFRAMDMEENQFTYNMIHASTFTEEQLPDLKEEVQYMNKNNPNHTFEIRKKL